MSQLRPARKISRAGFYIARSDRIWKGRKTRGKAKYKRFFLPKSLGAIKRGKFTDFEGNVWPKSGELPTTNRGGLIR